MTDTQEQDGAAAGPLPTPKHDVRVTIGGTSFAFTVDEARDVMCRVEDALWNAQPIMEADVRRSELLSLWRQEIAKRQDFERRLAEAEDRSADLAQERARHEAAESALRNEAHAASLALEADLAARYEGVVADLRQRNADMERQLAALAERCGESCAAEIAGLNMEVDIRGDILNKTNEVLGIEGHAPWHNIPDGVAHVCRSLATERAARERAEEERDHAIEMEARAVRRAEEAEESAERSERERMAQAHEAMRFGEDLERERRAHEETRRERDAAERRGDIANAAAHKYAATVERLTEALEWARMEVLSLGDAKAFADVNVSVHRLDAISNGIAERRDDALASVAPSPPEPHDEKPWPRSEIPKGIVIDPCKHGFCALVEGSVGSWNTAIAAARTLLGLTLPGRPTVAGEPPKGEQP